MTDQTSPRPNDGETPVTKTGSDPKSSDFGSGDGYSGDEYDAADHAAERHLQRDDHARAPSTRDQADDGRDIPSETGRRASFDRATGEVHGSGSGAGGGGNPGEDIDLDSVADRRAV